MANRELLSGIFQYVKRLNGLDRRDIPVPWLRCLEDYAFFSRHILGADGKEDLRLGAPLAAEYYMTRSKVIHWPCDAFAANTHIKCQMANSIPALCS